jgi:hypothetical protein
MKFKNFQQTMNKVKKEKKRAGLRIAVLHIRGKIIVVIFVHCGVGPSLFHGRSCAGARYNTQQPASALRSSVRSP